MRRKKEKAFMLLFIVYLILLFFIVILKIVNREWEGTINSIKFNREHGFWNYNITPFKTIKGYLFDCNYWELMLDNMMGNTVPFLPMGCFLGILLNNRNKILKVMVISFLIIFIFEVIQFLSCLGSFDIDDIILNVSSSLLGYFILSMFLKITNKD